MQVAFWVANPKSLNESNLQPRHLLITRQPNQNHQMKETCTQEMRVAYDESCSHHDKKSWKHLAPNTKSLKMKAPQETRNSKSWQDPKQLARKATLIMTIPNTKSLNESTPSNLHPRQISSWPYLKQLAPKATLIMTGTVNPKSLNESKLHPRQLSSWQHPKQL